MDMSQLNIVDIVILIIFFMSIIVGFVRGFISEVVSLATLIAAFVIAIAFSNSLASYFTSAQAVQSVVAQTSSVIGTSTAKPVSYLALGLSFFILFSVTMLVGAIVKYLLNIPFQMGMLGIGNRLLGGVFGFARGFLINLVIIFLIQLSPLATQPWWVGSKYVRDFQPAVGWLGNMVSPVLANIRMKVDSTLQNANSSIQGLVR